MSTTANTPRQDEVPLAQRPGRDVHLIYVSPYDVLRPSTNKISDVRFCEGFALNGADVEMIVPFVDRPDNLSPESVFPTYGVETRFRLTTLRTPWTERSPKRVVEASTVSATAWAVLQRLLTKRHSSEQMVVMSRSPALLMPVLGMKSVLRRGSGPMVVSWAHEVSTRRRHHWVYRAADGVVATNGAVAGDLEHEIGIPVERLEVSLNPISSRQLRERVERSTARRELNIDPETSLVVYTGKLYVGQKEAEHILAAAALLPDCSFLLTGGRPHVVEHFQRWCSERNIRNVSFTGYLTDYRRIAWYQAAADILLAYYSVADHAVRHNLPSKLCEYMLTGNPIVTCNFPAVRDTLDATCACFVAPDDPSALASGIGSLRANPAHARELAASALRKVSAMTFERRTAKVLEFFGRLRSLSRPA